MTFEEFNQRSSELIEKKMSAMSEALIAQADLQALIKEYQTQCKAEELLKKAEECLILTNMIKASYDEKEEVDDDAE